MKINYKFLSDTEPTEEQLHLLMQEVAVEVKKKANKSDEQFFEQLRQSLLVAQKRQLTLNSDAK
ncbi:MAG: hypothetical protein WCL21_00645 [Mariniphaga sp.]